MVNGPPSGSRVVYDLFLAFLACDQRTSPQMLVHGCISLFSDVEALRLVGVWENAGMECREQNSLGFSPKLLCLAGLYDKGEMRTGWKLSESSVGKSMTAPAARRRGRRHAGTVGYRGSFGGPGGAARVCGNAKSSRRCG